MPRPGRSDRKSTRLNSSHVRISYAVFCLKKTLSLETPICEEDDSHLSDFVPDDEAISPAEAASNLILREQIEDVLAKLTQWVFFLLMRRSPIYTRFPCTMLFR